MSPPARFRASNLQISCPLILLAGTSATVGKTKFAAKLAHFLSHDLGKTIAATKLAGAGNFDDLLNIGDAGAKYTFDFVDAGLASTYGDSADFKKMVVEVAKGILNYLGEKQPDAIIAELGGDILGANVPAILEDREVLSKTSTIVLVPSDTFAALGAITYLHDRGFDDSIIDVAQPLKNPAISQRRAENILHERLYDCENIVDLENLVKKRLGWERITHDEFAADQP